MVKLTEAAIRKRAEHHDGILADLEEISLHQLEIEKIEAIGTLCRKLRILYLQNNIISKIEGLSHMKSLEYLNMTLNNITLIEGLSACEFLNKLDLTCNFIDVDTLEASIEHLRSLLHLKELYLMGNPCQDWPSHRDYIIHCLPQLKSYDGKEITRSERILAAQQFGVMKSTLRELANRKRVEKGMPAVVYPAAGDEDDDDGKSEWSPAERTRMYREMAEQKAEQEKSRAHMEPKQRDYEKEHLEATERARAREAAGEIRQCNEGRWDFTLDEDDSGANIVFSIALPRYLDTSLVTVDTHPTHITLIIKGKVLRLRFPEEVLSESGTAKRSATTGELTITLPKAHASRVLVSKAAAGATAAGSSGKSGDAGAASAGPTSSSGRVKRLEAPQKLGDALLEEASRAVSTRGIVSAKDGGVASGFVMEERKAAKAPARPPAPVDIDDSDVPPLM